MDILPYLPPSSGYDHIITAIDDFSRYLFAYPVTRINATAVSRVIMDIICKHTYLPTTIITDLGTRFNAQITHEVAAVLGIEPKHATMKHAQTIGLLERTHASVKTHLKAATGEFRNNWHKYLPLADIFVRESDWQKDDQMAITKDDLYAQSWNTNFGSNPFDDGPTEYSLNTDDTEYIPIQIPEENRPPSPGSSKNSGGSPVEQTTVPDQNQENEILQQLDNKDDNTQKTQKDANISTDDDIQKTLRKFPKHPITRRSHKHPW